MSAPVNVARKRRSRHRITKTATPAKEPMELLGFEGSRHMIPERMPSARKEKTVGIRVIDLNTTAIENIKETADTLKRLDLSDLHLAKLNEDFVTTLRALERLDLGNNELNDDSFPNAFKKLDKLIELNLQHNNLTAMPSVVKRLKELRRLKLGNNKLTTTEGIEKLKKLQILLLDCNQLEYFPRELYSHLKRLEIFHASQNRLKDINSEIRFLRFLKDVDLSGNKLTSLPSELLLLPRLEVLNASSNQISRIPSINVKGRVNHKLASIDLSDNILIKFPEHLLSMTDKLDICKNKIKSIPGSSLKKLDMSSGQELLLYDNPLVSPPQDICECGIRSIVQYFQEAKAEMKIYQGIKVLVLGASGSGKTSLVQTLVDQQPRVTGFGEATIGVDMYDVDIDIENFEDEMEIESINDDSTSVTDEESTKQQQQMPKTLQISLWDFSGNKQYLLPHYYFLQNPTIVLLVFNMAEYDDSKFAVEIGFWIDFVLSKTHKIILLPVGTMADAVSAERASEICESVMHHIKRLISTMKSQIEAEIKKIEDMPHIPYSMSEQLKTYIRLLKSEVYIHKQAVPVSSKQYDGIVALFKTIEDISLNKELFPNVMRVIPSLWSEVENYVEDKAWSTVIPFMKWDDYCDEITNKFGMKHLMVPITKYLNDTGKVIWYSEHAKLKQYVFLRPSWLADVIKHIFRHNIGAIDYSMEENFKHNGITLEKFESITESIIKEGLVERDYLKGAWSGLVPNDSTKAIVEVLVVLLDFFELGYPIPKPGSKDAKVTWSQSLDVGKSLERSDSRGSMVSVFEKEENEDKPANEGKTTGKSSKKKLSKKDDQVQLPKITKVVIPFIRKINVPEAFTEEYQTYKHNPVLVATYRFPRFAPPGFFETMCVRALKASHGCNLLYNWEGGMYVTFDEKPHRMFLEREEQDDGSVAMKIEVRHTNDVEETEAEHIWTSLLPYLKDVEELLEKFAGAYVQRHMGCPRCGNFLSFLGEWQTPKELQNLPHKKCNTCQEDIPTDFLIQPKEKKRVEEFLLRKLKRDAEKRNASQTMTVISEENTTNNGSKTNNTNESKMNNPNDSKTNKHDDSTENNPIKSNNSKSNKSSSNGHTNNVTNLKENPSSSTNIQETPGLNDKQKEYDKQSGPSGIQFQESVQVHSPNAEWSSEKSRSPLQSPTQRKGRSPLQSPTQKESNLPTRTTTLNESNDYQSPKASSLKHKNSSSIKDQKGEPMHRSNIQKKSSKQSVLVNKQSQTQSSVQYLVRDKEEQDYLLKEK